MTNKYDRFFNQYSQRNTVLTKAIADSILTEELQTPYGNQNYVFQIGQKVFTTNQSQLKPGIELEITDRMIVHGYCKYYAGGVWHLQQDLTTL